MKRHFAPDLVADSTSAAGVRDRVEPARPENLSRLMRDAEGRLWRVREVKYADAAPSLVFESEGVFRRVRHYPRDWRDLSDPLLFALSWKT